jgi:hypothetical protein
MWLKVWNVIVGWIRQESVAATALVQAFIALGIAFTWWTWSTAQTGAVFGITSALLAMFVRSQVRPLHPLKARLGMEPHADPDTRPIHEAGTPPIHEPGTGPIHEPGTGPIHEPGTGPTHEPGTMPIHEPGTMPIHEPGTGHIPGPRTRPDSPPDGEGNPTEPGV